MCREPLKVAAMSTNDSRHLLAFCNNSNWNPVIGDVDQYPARTTPALFIPDPTIPDGDKKRLRKAKFPQILE